MEIQTLEENGILIVDIKGKLDTSTAPQAEKEIERYISPGRKMVLDLEQTSFVSSAGLRVFLATAKKVMAEGGMLRICGANEVVNEILEISGFTTILDVRKDRTEALQGLG